MITYDDDSPLYKNQHLLSLYFCVVPVCLWHWRSSGLPWVLYRYKSSFFEEAKISASMQDCKYVNMEVAPLIQMKTHSPGLHLKIDSHSKIDLISLWNQTQYLQILSLFWIASYSGVTGRSEKCIQYLSLSFSYIIFLVKKLSAMYKLSLFLKYANWKIWGRGKNMFHNENWKRYPNRPWAH